MTNLNSDSEGWDHRYEPPCLASSFSEKAPIVEASVAPGLVPSSPLCLNDSAKVRNSF